VRFLLAAPETVFGGGLILLCTGEGDKLTALIVLPLEETLLSTETFLVCEGREDKTGRIVFELSSEKFPAVNDFGGDNFRGEEGVFLGDKGGNGGIGADAVCGDLNVNPPSKSLSQSSSSVFAGVL
jgi:hypothetical protein